MFAVAVVVVGFVAVLLGLHLLICKYWIWHYTVTMTVVVVVVAVDDAADDDDEQPADKRPMDKINIVSVGFLLFLLSYALLLLSIMMMPMMIFNEAKACSPVSFRIPCTQVRATVCPASYYSLLNLYDDDVKMAKTKTLLNNWYHINLMHTNFSNTTTHEQGCIHTYLHTLVHVHVPLYAMSVMIM